MSLPNYPSQQVKEFGEAVASAMMNAGIQKAMGGLGGCKHLDLSDYPADVVPYVKAYIEGSHDSVALMYAAMKTKEQESS